MYTPQTAGGALKLQFFCFLGPYDEEIVIIIIIIIIIIISFFSSEKGFF